MSNQLQRTSSGPSVGWKILLKLSSLKITVVLFSLSIFLVLVGTLAQATEGIWTVIDDYFRSFVVFIPFKAFLPPAWFPNFDVQEYLASQNFPLSGIIFPGGKTLGVALMINLLAAHIVRFKANGTKTSIGWGIAFIASGLFLTTMIVLGASYADGVQDEPMVSYVFIWRSMLSALVAIAAALTGMIFFMEKNQTLEKILLGIGITLAIVAASALYVLGSMYEQLESAMRIVWQLTQATVVGCVLLTGCAMIFRNRGGIVLLHFGISLMMVNELFVGIYAVEEKITVAEGEKTEYAYNTQDVELAVTFRGSEEDKVVSFPLRLLKPGTTLSHDSLPFQLQVESYFPNSKLAMKSTPGGIDQFMLKGKSVKVQPMVGRGFLSKAENVARITGADVEQKVDMASAYVSVLGAEVENRIMAADPDNEEVKQNVLLVSQHYSDFGSLGRDDGANSEKIVVDGVIYEIALRFRRAFKPYSIFLTDTFEESHHGSTKHKSFGSRFTVTDTSTGEIQQCSITMNNPLRYKGETFYQSGYFQRQTPRGMVEVTTLQVVTNQGWMIPYVGCMYVVIGMLAQFCSGMLKFTERIQKRKVKKTETKPQKSLTPSNSNSPAAAFAADQSLGGSRSKLIWILPLIIFLLGAMFSYRMTFSGKAKSGEFDIKAAGEIPVSSGGRFQPIDTFARVTLRNFSDYESVSLTEEQRDRGVKGGRKRVYATEWLLDVITNPELADQEYRIFRVYDPFLITELDLQKGRKGYTYTYNEIAGNIDDFIDYANEAMALQKANNGKLDKLSFQQRKAISLLRRIRSYEEFRNSTLFVDIHSDTAVEKLITDTVIYRPNFGELEHKDNPLKFVDSLAERVLDEDRAAAINYLIYVSRFADPRTGSMVKAQNNSPLFVPTCQVAEITVDNQAARLRLPLGQDSEQLQVMPGTIVRQSNDDSMWRLLNASRDPRTAPSELEDWVEVPAPQKEPEIAVSDEMARLELPLGENVKNDEVEVGTVVHQTNDDSYWKLVSAQRDPLKAPSKELDWEKLPGMEVLTISSARLALIKYCQRHEITKPEDLIEKLIKSDRNYIDLPEDPDKRQQVILDFQTDAINKVDDFFKRHLPEIKSTLQRARGQEVPDNILATLKNLVTQDFLEEKSKQIDQLPMMYQLHVTNFFDYKAEKTDPETQADPENPPEKKLTPKINPSEKFFEILQAYKDGNVEQFNQHVDDYMTFFNGLNLSEYDSFRNGLELFYHYSTPLFQALIFYGIAALFVVLTWVFYGLSLNDIGAGMQRSALVLLALGNVIHTAGIVERVLITGKAPVTNLYASAVFISWGSVVCGFIIDAIVRYASPKASKLGIGALLGSIMGFMVIMVSFNLALRTDTFGKVEAVLDTQFWLATHVVCVTFGYVATFVAGALGLVFIVGSAYSPVFDKEIRQGISWIIYGIVCFALLLSFFGTVLGGLWADDSWGRFWGWDPKENGALLIVIWNALILHARWGGMIRERGLAILALGGNIVTCWSWFGVNELGVGLHSYGFTDGMLATLFWIASAHLLVIIAAASIPTSMWAGYKADKARSALASTESPTQPPRKTNAPKRKSKNKNQKSKGTSTSPGTHNRASDPGDDLPDLQIPEDDR